MELNEVLEARRSIRAYEAGRPVERALVEEMLVAAQQAPTWKNSQTGRYYVVTDPEMLARVKGQCLPPFNAGNCAQAPVLIVTAYETCRSGFNREGAAENEVGNGWGAYDLGLQNGNLLLKATELGLGTLVMGIRDGEALRALLQIPESQAIMAVIAVGYAAIAPEKPVRKAPEKIAAWY